MKRIILILSLLVCIYSCQGPEGPAGPVGPEGPPSTANIKTIIFSFTSSSVYILDNIGGYSEKVDEITQDVVDSGMVLIYMELSDGWLSLPFTFGRDIYNNLDVDEVITMTYSYDVGSVFIFYATSYGTLYRSQCSGGRFKVVIIMPPALNKFNNIDIKDHDKLMNFLNISN